MKDRGHQQLGHDEVSCISNSVPPAVVGSHVPLKTNQTPSTTTDNWSRAILYTLVLVMRLLAVVVVPVHPHSFSSNILLLPRMDKGISTRMMVKLRSRTLAVSHKTRLFVFTVALYSTMCHGIKSHHEPSKATSSERPFFIFTAK